MVFAFIFVFFEFLFYVFSSENSKKAAAKWSDDDEDSDLSESEADSSKNVDEEEEENEEIDSKIKASPQKKRGILKESQRVAVQGQCASFRIKDFELGGQGDNAKVYCAKQYDVIGEKYTRGVLRRSIIRNKADLKMFWKEIAIQKYLAKFKKGIHKKEWKFDYKSGLNYHFPHFSQFFKKCFYQI